MSECVVRMEMPRVCITENGYYGYCPMDKVWCIQRNAPPDITMGEAYKAMTNKIPSWCPIICQLPEGHGRLVDGDKLLDEMKNRKWMIGRASDPDCLVFDAPTIVPAERREK